MYKIIYKNKNIVAVILAIFIFIITYGLSDIFYNSNKFIQNYSYKLISKYNKKKVTKKLIVVKIDEKTLKSLGRFPFDRKKYIPVINNLNKLGVSVIGFDIIFADKSNSVSDKLFALSIKKSNNIVLGTSILKNGNIELPLPNFLTGNNLIGYLPPKIDKKNNTVYSINPFRDFKEYAIVEHFSVSIIRKYYEYFLGKKNTQITPNITFDNTYNVLDDVKLPMSMYGKNDFLINYIDNNNFKKVSFIDLYNGEVFKGNTDDFKDAIVLIGTAADGIKDVFFTPNGVEYGVYIHANIINTILNKSFLKYFNKNIELFLIFLSLILLIYSNLHTTGKKMYLNNLLIVLLFLFFIPFVSVFYTSSILNYFIETVFSFILAITITNILKYLIEKKHKIKLSNALSEYISADIANEIMYETGAVNLDGEEKELTIFFSDIKGFTTISENYTPKELVGFLKKYLGKMSNIIIAEYGFVNKYEGDAIMALWGAFERENKENDLNACRSALLQQKCIRELNKEGPKIKVRMGIHSGKAIVGNIGSKGRKMEFTALGDSVNLASRLEGINKFYDTEICVSEAVYQKCKIHFQFRFIDIIRVKGKSIKVKIYELLGEKGKIGNLKLDTLKKFNDAIKYYQNRDFKIALNLFIYLAKLGDGPSITYKKRCEEYIKNPPNKNWDGVFKYNEK